MTSTTININKWKDICKDAFNGNKTANDFVLFIESCSKDNTFTTENESFHTLFQQLDIHPSENKYFVNEETLLQLTEMKRKARTEWHQERQIQLKQHLKSRLNTTDFSIVDNQEERKQRVKEYMKKSDLSCVPLLRGLVGVLKFQLVHPQHLVDWHMKEYTLTQKEDMDKDIELIRDILGLQLIYKDHSSDTVIPIDDDVNDDEEEVFVWRMNKALTNQDIQEILKLLPKDQNREGYFISDIEREHPIGWCQWLYQTMMNCFSSILGIL